MGRVPRRRLVWTYALIVGAILVVLYVALR
jgi:hypothetical protein